MSYQIGMDAIHLKPTPRLAHTEYCSNDSLKRRVEAKTGKQLAEAWEFDLLWSTNDGPIPFSDRGRSTDMGHAEFLENGTDWREPQPSPFTDPEQVLEFDAVEEFGLLDFDDLVAYYEDTYSRTQRDNPDQIFTSGYYKTIVSGAIDVFGWDMLLEAAADQERFEAVLDSIFRLTLHHVKAWAKTSAPVFICHDDMVWSEGPFIHPDFYRKVIFPRYAELWKVLKDAGKKVLYCSDGTWTEFVDDIADAGADGFIFEPTTSLDLVVEKYGQTHVIVGSHVDCRTLTFGTTNDFKAEIDSTLELTHGCRGFMFAVGNHIPSNVPVDNALFFFDYLSKNWAR